MQSYDLIIVRPYAVLPNEGGGVDRYITLHSYAKKTLKTLLCVSNYRHNTKEFRNFKFSKSESIELINAGSYKSNLSIQRLIHEIRFSYKSFRIVKMYGAKSVLIGEPLFFGWIFFFWLKLTRGTIIFGDFIDLMPEAYMVKFKSRFIFWLIFWPFYITRWLRVNFLYDRVFTVSLSYSNSILNASSRVMSVFYWGLKSEQISESFRQKNKLVYAGSLGEGYDIETLIELGRVRPDLQIVIAGSGPKAHLCKIAHDRGYILFMGQIGVDDLRHLYRDATFGILPYKKNSAVSMPIKFYEYLTYGLVIINSLELECSEIIKKYRLGGSYISGNVLSLSNAIDSASVISISEDAKKNLIEKFSVEKQYKSFVDSIADYIAGKYHNEKMS